MGRKKIDKPEKLGFKRNVEMMKCAVCAIDILKKTSNQKYCCKCNGMINRESARASRIKKNEEKQRNIERKNVTRGD